MFEGGGTGVELAEPPLLPREVLPPGDERLERPLVPVLFPPTLLFETVVGVEAVDEGPASCDGREILSDVRPDELALPDEEDIFIGLGMADDLGWAVLLFTKVSGETDWVKSLVVVVSSNAPPNEADTAVCVALVAPSAEVDGSIIFVSFVFAGTDSKEVDGGFVPCVTLTLSKADS